MKQILSLSNIRTIISILLLLCAGVVRTRASFPVNSRVQIIGEDKVNVRDVEAGKILGQNHPGAAGSVTDGPILASLNGTLYTWYAVSFDVNLNPLHNDKPLFKGWVADKYIQQTAPRAPSGLTPNSGNGPPILVPFGNAVNLKWDRDPMASHYLVVVFDSANTIAFQASVFEPNRELNVTVPCGNISYTVTSLNGSSSDYIRGGTTDRQQIQVEMPPAPYIQTLERSGGAINVNWQGIVPQADSIELWRRTLSSDRTLYRTLPVNLSGISDYDILDSETYFYTVRSKVGKCYSDFSNEVTSERSSYTITLTAGDGGVLSPGGNQVVDRGASITLKAMPNENFRVDAWYVNGQILDNGQNDITLQNVRSDMKVHVTFKKQLYAITVRTIGSGTVIIDPPGGQYYAGTPVTLEARPDEGYQLSEWSGALYSRLPRIVLNKGGANEILDVAFVKESPKVYLNTSIAHSTPERIISVEGTENWFSLFETSADLESWTPLTVVDGKSGKTEIMLPFDEKTVFVRTSQRPVVTTMPFLRFPVHTATSKSAPVTALMDHHRIWFEVNLNVIKDKDHKIGTLMHDVFNVLADDQGDLRDFARIPKDKDVSGFFNYVGVSDQLGKEALQYDGHAGYDYSYTSTDIYPAAMGKIAVDSDFSDSNLAGTAIATEYMSKFHAVIIMHQEGYCTVYMHLSEIKPQYVDSSNPNRWLPRAGTVTIDEPLGVTGDFCDSCPEHRVPEHFHFEVWRRDGNTWRYADPYGEHYQRVIAPNLWIN